MAMLQLGRRLGAVVCSSGKPALSNLCAACRCDPGPHLFTHHSVADFRCQGDSTPLKCRAKEKEVGRGTRFNTVLSKTGHAT